MSPYQKAQQALRLLKEAIEELLEQKSDGLRNAEIANILEIHSDYKGGQKDYLSWSVLGLLMNEERVVRKGYHYFVAGAEK